MEHNWTLEDFYAGKVSVRYDNERFEDIERLIKAPVNSYGRSHNFYQFNQRGELVRSDMQRLPSMPLSYFISLLDAAEKQPEHEYIYEPFSEEAAMLTGTIVTYDELIVDFARKGKNGVCIVNEHGELFIVKESDLRIRRAIETKEVECYVYEDGYITSEGVKGHGHIKDTFTHTIKIPKK